MRLQQIRYIMEIARCHSINKAALNLFITQPTLSAAVKDLEEELAITIFERSRKGVTLTIEGIEFLQLAEKLLQQADAITERYSKEKTPGPVHLQISCQHYAFVTEAFIHFLQQSAHEKYVFNVKETETLEAIEDVYRKDSALGIISLSPYNQAYLTQVLDRQGITFHELLQVTPHAFMRKAHLLACRKEISLDELAPYPIVVYEQDNPANKMTSEEMIILDDPQKLIYSHDRGTTNNIIASTDCYTIGTGYIIPGIIPDEITSIPLTGYGDQIQLGWIQLKNQELSPEAQTFLELIKDSLWNNYPGTGAGRH